MYAITKIMNVSPSMDQQQTSRSRDRIEAMGIRKSQSEGLDSLMSSTSDSYHVDDETDIYPETEDEEYYTNRWINRQTMTSGR